MTAVNGTIDGMPNTRESAILAAAVEAVVWKHPIEQISEEGKRKTPRVVIYPVEMPQLEEEMNEFLQNPSELEDGKHIAYSKILEKGAEFESSPRFYREDSSEPLSDPEFATIVPNRMNIAAQTSVGGRDLVLENGPDTMNSDDEESLKEEHGEVSTGMYTEGLKAPVWSYAKSQGYGAIISDSPQASGFERGESSEFDLPNSQSVHSSPALSMGGSEIESSALSDASESESPPASQKGKGSGKKGSGKKAATRPAEHPMVTRSKETSRAGGLRPVGGPGQTDTCVAQSHPSKT